MKMNQWTLGLAALGLVSLTSAQAEEAKLVPLETALSATTISGYVDTSAAWNPGTGNANPAPYAFNTPDKQDGFNLNLVDLKLEKLIDPNVPWSAGYTVEGLFGPDSDAVTGSDAKYLRQAYVDLSAPVGNVPDIKIGRFDTVVGYEVTDAYKNPNFTRSYGYSLEPTEHTGVLAHYKVAEYLDVQAGVADRATTGSNINDRSARAESHKAYLGLITLTAPDSWGFLANDAIYGGIDYGSGSDNEDRTHLYAGANINTPLKDLVFGAAYDSIFHTDVNGADYGYSAAVAGYASYKLTEKLTTSVRLEYAQGAALGALAQANAGIDPDGQSDFHKVMALTGTISYDLWANVLTRLEVRWDHALDHSTPFGGETAGVGSDNNAIVVAANVVYKF